MLDTTLCDKVVSDLRQVGDFSAGIPISSTNKTDRHDIDEIFVESCVKPLRKIVVPEANLISLTHTCMYITAHFPMSMIYKRRVNSVTLVLPYYSDKLYVVFLYICFCLRWSL